MNAAESKTPFEVMLDTIKAGVSPYALVALVTLFLLHKPPGAQFALLANTALCLVGIGLCLWFSAHAHTGVESQKARIENLRFATAIALSAGLIAAHFIEADGYGDLPAIVIGSTALIQILAFVTPLYRLSKDKAVVSDFNALQFAVVCAVSLHNADALAKVPSSATKASVNMISSGGAMAFYSLWLWGIIRWRRYWREGKFREN